MEDSFAYAFLRIKFVVHFTSNQQEVSVRPTILSSLKYMRAIHYSLVKTLSYLCHFSGGCRNAEHLIYLEEMLMVGVMLAFVGCLCYRWRRVAPSTIIVEVK